MENESFSLRLKVRDYECDSGNGVNNAVFLNYLEFSRFEFLREELKWDLPALTAQNIGFVVARIEVEFKRSLVAGDQIVVETVMKRLSKRRFLFEQEIYIETTKESATTRKLSASAKVHCTAINIKTGRSETPEALEKLLCERYPVPVSSPTEESYEAATA